MYLTKIGRCSKNYTLDAFLKFPVFTPNKYVWHVSRSKTEKRQSILSKGFLPEYSFWNLTFVNNRIYDPSNLWIIREDCFMFPCKTSFESPEHIEFVCSHYDFWRIDTTLIPHVTWKLDPNLMYVNVQEPGNYLCTNQVIPSHCIKLFKPIKNKVKRRMYEIQTNNHVVKKSFNRMNLSPIQTIKEQSSWLEEINIQNDEL